MARTAFAGEWLPKEQEILSSYRKNFIKKVYAIDDLDDDRRKNPPKDLLLFHPCIQDLKNLIETDAEMYMLFTTMFTQQPLDPDLKTRVLNYTDMLIQINSIITTAPSFSGAHVPINALLKYAMATPSGTIAFLNEKVNKCFKAILLSWAQFLDNPDSRHVLDREKKDSWLSRAALAKMKDFTSTYQYDSNDKKYWGFKSWNDFFARKLQPGAREVPNGSDENTIVAACESTPYRIKKADDVKFCNTFWIKGQPYSLEFMLNNEPIAKSFEGGTVYQYFLSTYSYHRWHVPVDGTIMKAYVASGGYYAEALSIGYDPTADTESQSYLANVDNRAIILIEATSSAVGVVALVMIGMAEIAGLVIDVYEGQGVRKGDPLGTFQYGGSSYVMCFQKGVDVQFIVDPIPEEPTLVKVKSKVAQVKNPPA